MVLGIKKKKRIHNSTILNAIKKVAREHKDISIIKEPNIEEGIELIRIHDDKRAEFESAIMEIIGEKLDCIVEGTSLVMRGNSAVEVKGLVAPMANKFGCKVLKEPVPTHSRNGLKYYRVFIGAEKDLMTRVERLRANLVAATGLAIYYY